MIRARHLSKRYRMERRSPQPDTVAGMLLKLSRAPADRIRALRGLTRFRTDERDVIWALEDVSFDVATGEVLGVIGRNGAGKSTLLKILARITDPTTGFAEITGRVASLLEVGTGFHYDLTGRENVYLNAAILGMGQAETRRRFDEIIDFSGVEPFIDTPLKRYSSGMKVRLAFAVAAHIEPDVLLIDEVLAVGDVMFQRKCLGKMREVGRAGRTVIFVTHQMSAVRSLCDRALLLRKGRIALDSNTDEVISEYLEDGTKSAGIALTERTDRQGNGHFRFEQIRFLSAAGVAVEYTESAAEMKIELRYRVRGSIRRSALTVSIRLQDTLGETVALFASDEMGIDWSTLPDEGSIVLHIPSLTLREGYYTASLWASSPTTRPEDLHDAIELAGSLHVSACDYWGTGQLNRPGAFAVIDASMTHDVLDNGYSQSSERASSRCAAIDTQE